MAENDKETYMTEVTQSQEYQEAVNYVRSQQVYIDRKAIFGDAIPTAVLTKLTAAFVIINAYLTEVEAQG